MTDLPSRKHRQPIHPLEIVSSKEILTARIASEASLAREIQDMQTVFRADVIKLLGDIGALHDGVGWVTFGGSESTDVIDQGDRWQGLILCHIVDPEHVKTGNLHTPSIRIIHHEEYRTEYGIEWLTNDLMTDEDGDAFHAVGSLIINMNGEVDPNKHFVPIFYVSDGELNYFAPSAYPCVVNYQYSRHDGTDSVVPFGVYDNPHTKIDVLDSMKAYLAKFKATPVQAHYSPN